MPLYLPADTYATFQGQNAVAQSQGDYETQSAGLQVVHDANMQHLQNVNDVVAPQSAPDPGLAAGTGDAPPPVSEPSASPPPAVSLPPMTDTPTLPAPTTAPSAAPAGPSLQSALDWGKQQMGKGYIWGSAGGRSDLSGNAPGYDCSGFVSQFYHQMGMSVPAQTAAAYAATSPLAEKDARPGDIVEFNMGSNDPHQQHIAVYLGNGKIMQSGGTRGDVNIGNVDQFGAGSYEFRRAAGGPPQAAAAATGDVAATAAVSTTAAKPEPTTASGLLQSIQDDWDKGKAAVTGAVAPVADTASSVLAAAHDAYSKGVDAIFNPPAGSLTAAQQPTPSDALTHPAMQANPTTPAAGTLAAPPPLAPGTPGPLGWNSAIPASNPAGVALPNGEQLVPDIISPLTSAPGKFGDAAGAGDPLAMAGVILGVASDAGSMLPGGGEAKAGSELASLVSRAPPEALQSALSTAEKAVADLRTRFPQMSDGSVAASGAGKQLSTLQDAMKEAGVPTGPYAPGDILERAGNDTGVVPPRDVAPPESGAPPPVEPPTASASLGAPQPSGPSAGNVAWGMMAEGKKSIFSLNVVHAMNIFRGLTTSQAGPGAAVDFAKAFANGMVHGVTEHPQVTAALDEATKDGVQFFTNSPETGGAAVGINPLLVKGAQATLGGVSSASSAYGISKAAGASDEDTLRNTVVAGAIGAIAGPTLSIRMHDVLWKDAVPLAKVLTWQAGKNGGLSGPEAAKFANNLNGGQNLAQIAGSKPLQDMARLIVQSPDWLLSQLKLTRDAAIGTAKTVADPGSLKSLVNGQMNSTAMTGSQQASRDWLIKQLMVYGFATEALQKGLTGHFTDQNSPGREFQVEVPATNSKGAGDNITASLFDGNLQQVLDAAAKHDPGATIAGKLNPWISTPVEEMTNKTFLGANAPAIYKSTDDALTQKAKQAQFAASKFAPLGISSPLQEYYAGAPVPLIAASALTGIPMSHNSGGASARTLQQAPRPGASSHPGVTGLPSRGNIPHSAPSR